MKKTLTTALSLVFVLGLMAGPALANGPDLERGNWLSRQATPVELDPGQVIDRGQWLEVRHGIYNNCGNIDTLVQREPVRYQHNVVTQYDEPAEWNTAWLRILDSNLSPVDHQGALHWYYNTEDCGWLSLTFQFDGEGNLLHVNGVTPE